MTGYREVLDLCIYNDSPRSRTFLQSLCFYLIKTRPPLFNCAIKQTVRNRWGETTSWSATIWGATFPDLLLFGASFFLPKVFLIGHTLWKIICIIHCVHNIFNIIFANIIFVFVCHQTGQLRRTWYRKYLCLFIRYTRYTCKIHVYIFCEEMHIYEYRFVFVSPQTGQLRRAHSFILEINWID